MKNVWKWILGILGVLALLAVLIGVPLLMHSVYGYGSFARFDTDGPQVMMGGRGSYGHGMFPMMGGMLFLMGFRWLLPLLLVGLVVYGAYRYGKRHSLPAAPAAPQQTCPKCGQPVQPGWNNCASCGKKLS